MRNYIKMEESVLVELGDSEYSFAIVTEVDFSEMRNNLLFMKGKAYSYDEGEAEEIGEVEIQYSLTEDAYEEVE